MTSLASNVRPPRQAPAWALPRRVVPGPLPFPSRPAAEAGERAGVRDPGTDAAERAGGPRMPSAVAGGPEARRAPTAAVASAGMVVTSLAEALRGERTVRQLTVLLDHEAYLKVQRRVTWEREARVMEGRPAEDERTRVLSCHVQAIDEDACECTATLLAPHRARALAFRMERVRERWRCVEIELG